MTTPLTLTRPCAVLAAATRLDASSSCRHSAGWMVRRGAATAVRPAARAHDLVAAPAEIPDRRAPHVHQPREREDQEDRHAEEEVRLEDRVRVGDQRPGVAGCSIRMPCAQSMNFTISWPSRWPMRDRDGRQPEQQLGEQQQQDRDVAEGRGGADARDRTGGGASAARCRSRQKMPAMPPTTIAIICLKPWQMPSASNTQIGVSRPTKWPKKITRMPTWNRFEPHISWRRRSSWLDPRPPGVLLAVEAQQAAEQEHGQAEVGIPAEHDVS